MQNNSNSQLNETLTFNQILRDLYHYRLVILIVCLSFSAIGVIRLLSSPALYQVSMILAPVPNREESSSGSSNLSLSQLIVNSDKMRAPTFSKFLDILTSTPVAERLENKYHFLEELNAKQWDETNHSWKQNTSAWVALKRKIKLIYKIPSYRDPNYTDLAAFASSQMKIKSFEKSELVSLVINTPNPDFAVRFLTGLHQEADEVLKEIATKRTNEEIEITREKLKITDDVDQQKVLLDLLSRFQKIQLISSGNLPYAAEVLFAPSIPPSPIERSPLFTAILYFAAAFALSSLCLILRISYRARNR